MSIKNLANASEIVLNAPLGAKYWDIVDDTYVKNLSSIGSGEFEWECHSLNDEWDPCSALSSPLLTGDFILIDDIRELTKGNI